MSELDKALSVQQRRKVQAVIREEINEYLRIETSREVEQAIQVVTKQMKPEIQRLVTEEFEKKLPKLVKDLVSFAIREINY